MLTLRPASRGDARPADRPTRPAQSSGGGRGRPAVRRGSGTARPRPSRRPSGRRGRTTGPAGPMSTTPAGHGRCRRDRGASRRCRAARAGRSPTSKSISSGQPWNASWRVDAYRWSPQRTDRWQLHAPCDTTRWSRPTAVSPARSSPATDRPSQCSTGTSRPASSTTVAPMSRWYSKPVDGAWRQAGPAQHRRDVARRLVGGLVVGVHAELAEALTVIRRDEDGGLLEHAERRRGGDDRADRGIGVADARVVAVEHVLHRGHVGDGQRLAGEAPAPAVGVDGRSRPTPGRSARPGSSQWAARTSSVYQVGDRFARERIAEVRRGVPRRVRVPEVDVQEPFVVAAVAVEPVERARQDLVGALAAEPAHQVHRLHEPWFHHDAEWRNGKLEIDAVRQPAA